MFPQSAASNPWKRGLRRSLQSEQVPLRIPGVGRHISGLSRLFRHRQNGVGARREYSLSASVFFIGEGDRLASTAEASPPVPAGNPSLSQRPWVESGIRPRCEYDRPWQSCHGNRACHVPRNEATTPNNMVNIYPLFGAGNNRYLSQADWRLAIRPVEPVARFRRSVPWPMPAAAYTCTPARRRPDNSRARPTCRDAIEKLARVGKGQRKRNGRRQCEDAAGRRA